MNWSLIEVIMDLGILFQKYTYTDAINTLSTLISEHRSIKSGRYKKLAQSYIDKLDPADYPTYNSAGELVQNFKSNIDEEK